MFKSIEISLPGNVRHTMDPKFLFILFFVEVGSLVFNSLHMASSEVHVYNAYNELPVIYQVSSKAYTCFSTVNYCIYENKQFQFLKILDLVFISIIVLCYGCLFVIILRKWEDIKIHSNFKITWSSGIQLLVLFTLALHTLLMIILFERDSVNTDQCNKQNRLVRVENIFNYFVVSIIEVAYIGFNLVNRQAAPINTQNQEIQYGDQADEDIRLRSSENIQRVSRNWN